MKAKSFMFYAVLSIAILVFSTPVLADTTDPVPSPTISNSVDIKVDASSSIGTASAAIPIEVPPGRNGIAPNLALTYNSGMSNGWVGVGWNLGIGAIQRNTKRGVDYSGADTLTAPYVVVINGSSTELVARADWGSGYFGEKIERSFSKYHYDGYNWVVTTKDGTKYYYGHDPYRPYDARQDNAHGTFKWCLVRVQDTNGNYMIATYWKNNGEIYLDEIDYTGNTNGPGPTNYVKFLTDTGARTDAPPMYTSNSEVETYYRLKTIEVHANGELARKYELEYDADLDTPDLQYSSSTGRSLLGKVTQYGWDGSQLPSQTFKYTSGGTSFDPVPGNGPDVQVGTGDDWKVGISRIKYGDFNGDGKMDIIRINGWGTTEAISIWLSNGNGGFTAVSDPSIPTIYIGDTIDAANFDISRVQIGDFDGDGKSDILIIRGWGTTSAMDIYLSNGDGSFRHVTGPLLEVGNEENWTAAIDISRVKLGDFNGDGKTDILIVHGWDAVAYMEIDLSTGTGFIPIAGPSTGMYIGSSDTAYTDIARVKLGDCADGYLPVDRDKFQSYFRPYNTCWQYRGSSICRSPENKAG